MLQLFTARPGIVLIRILTQIFIVLVIFLVSCHIKMLILQPWGLGICKLVLGLFYLFCCILLDAQPDVESLCYILMMVCRKFMIT